MGGRRKDIPFARLDFSRKERTGFGETVFGAGKTPGQLAGIFAEFSERRMPVLATRVTKEQFDAVVAAGLTVRYDPVGRLLVSSHRNGRLKGRVAVLTGGTADIAPLRETTAAILLQEMLWRRKTPLHDPFCGSGTIAIEATLYAFNVAPGFGRQFGIENLPIFNADRAKQIIQEEAAKIRPDVEVRITGSDIDPKAVARAKQNAEHACVMAGRALHLIGKSSHIQRPDFIQADFSSLQAPYPEGLLLCNPPYGERLGTEEEAQELYSQMSNLKYDFPNWDIGVITSAQNFESSFKHQTSSVKTIKAGNLDTKFYIYKSKYTFPTP